MWWKGLHDGNNLCVRSRYIVRRRDGNGGVRNDDRSEETMKLSERIIFGDEKYMLQDDFKTCGDCGAERGEYHWINCDMEECPVCKGQRLSCGCRRMKGESA
jgi:hypothetical protein